MVTKRTQKLSNKISTGEPVRRQTARPRQLVLGAQLKISNTSEIKSVLAGFLNRKQLTIDASGLEKVDTAGLQLLTAFVLEAGKKSIRIKWQSPSSVLLNAARLSGLGESLKLPPSLDDGTANS